MPTFGVDTCGTYGFDGTIGADVSFLCAKVALLINSATTAAEMHRRSETRWRRSGMTSFGEIIFADIICGKTDPAPTSSYTYDAFWPGGVYTNLNNLQAHGAEVKDGQLNRDTSGKSESAAMEATSTQDLSLNVYRTEAHDHTATGDAAPKTDFRMKPRHQKNLVE